MHLDLIFFQQNITGKTRQCQETRLTKEQGDNVFGYRQAIQEMRS
jgi:hypothetical protein